ncbi:MAG: polyprenyl synthetase family protein [Anaerolineae bacterium]|nr:polyprenyl synthetase family protein [Anaerolineae bacterium]MDW8101634.1 polyprenyl synthetase family protein [Anaerolineae bacterium]
MKKSWKEKATDYLPSVEEFLRKIVGEGEGELSRHYGMMRYHMGWADEELRPITAPAGKRLRPLLCLLSCEAAGGNWEEAIPAAAALELVHNFSLVHDDIQDRSPFRRHRPTVWKLWGEALAINVGDALLILACRAMEKVPKEKFRECCQILIDACLMLTEGQFLDLTFEKKERVVLEEYMEMIRRKTAALIAASAQIGATIATDERRIVERFRSFGENLGMAFQVQDDILGLWGDEAVTGKPVADDLRQRKKTLPIIYAMEKDPRLLSLMAQVKWGEGEVAEALEIINRSGAKEFAQAQAFSFYEKALEELAGLGQDSEAMQALRDLASFMVGREY